MASHILLKWRIEIVNNIDKFVEFPLKSNVSPDALYDKLNNLEFLYHTFRFEGGFVAHGDYDVSVDIQDYPFPADLSGISVLDVGVGSGWMSIYLALHGAQVTAFDARGLCDMDIFGEHEYRKPEAEKPEFDRILSDGTMIRNNRTSDALFLVSEAVGVDIRFRSGRYMISHRFSLGRFLI